MTFCEASSIYAQISKALFGDDDDAEFWGTMDSQEDSQKDEQARKRDRWKLTRSLALVGSIHAQRSLCLACFQSGAAGSCRFALVGG